jgi:hypothetical protein
MRRYSKPIEEKRWNCTQAHVEIIVPGRNKRINELAGWCGLMTTLG